MPMTLDNFVRDSGSKDGLSTWCKKCKAQYNKTKKEERSIYYKKYHEDKPEYRKKYYQQNKNYFLGMFHKRRDREGNLPNDFSVADWEKCLEYFSNSCAYCGKTTREGLQQEHVIPVVKGGGYTKDNIIPACPACNKSKHASDVVEWYTGRDFFKQSRIDRIKNYLEE